MVRITLSQLREIVANGATKQEIADTFGLPMTQVVKLLKQANLKTKRQIAPKFELIDDTVESTTTEIENNVQQEILA